MKNIEGNESKNLIILVKMPRVGKNMIETRNRSCFFEANFEKSKQFQKNMNFIQCFQSNLKQNSHTKKFELE